MSRGGKPAAADRRRARSAPASAGRPARGAGELPRVSDDFSTYSAASLVRRSWSHQVSMSLLDTSRLVCRPNERRDTDAQLALGAPAGDPMPRTGRRDPRCLESGWAAPNVASRLTDRAPPCRSRSGPTAACRNCGRWTAVRAAAAQAGGDDREGPEPRSPHCAATFGTCAAGTAITARSTPSGKASADATQARPSRAAARGLTGYTMPENPPVTMFRKISGPRFPAAGSRQPRPPTPGAAEAAGSRHPRGSHGLL